MKPIQLDRDVVPAGALKTQTTRILRQLREECRPIVITEHGKPAGVLVPTADFERLIERERFIDAINEGLRDSEAGRLISNDALTADLDLEFGPLEAA